MGLINKKEEKSGKQETSNSDFVIHLLFAENQNVNSAKIISENESFFTIKETAKTGDRLTLDYTKEGGTPISVTITQHNEPVPFKKKALKFKAKKMNEAALFFEDTYKNVKNHTAYLEIEMNGDDSLDLNKNMFHFYHIIYSITDAYKPTAVNIPHVNAFYCFEDFDEYGYGRLDSYMFLVTFMAIEVVKDEDFEDDIYIYTNGLSKFGEKELQIKVDLDEAALAFNFMMSLSLNCLGTTSSYNDGESTNNHEGEFVRFNTIKSPFLGIDVLNIE